MKQKRAYSKTLPYVFPLQAHHYHWRNCNSTLLLLLAVNMRQFYAWALRDTKTTTMRLLGFPQENGLYDPEIQPHRTWQTDEYEFSGHSSIPNF